MLAMEAVRAEEGAILRSEAAGTGPKIGKPTLKQPMFDWCTKDKYKELRNLRLEVNNILQTYNANYAEYPL